MGYILELNNRDAIKSVELNIQNTDDATHGLCKGCGGKYSNSTYNNGQNNSTLEDFSRQLPNINIYIQHGSKRTNSIN